MFHNIHFILKPFKEDQSFKPIIIQIELTTQKFTWTCCVQSFLAIGWRNPQIGGSARNLDPSGEPKPLS
jgi:hypothetical protein